MPMHGSGAVQRRFVRTDDLGWPFMAGEKRARTPKTAVFWEKDFHFFKSCVILLL